MYKVLIVEDEFLQKEAMKSMINDRFDNIQVVGTAQDGEEALDKFKVLKPDIVLMDIHIPKLNGLEASKKMKTLNPNVSIIILTAYSEFSYAQQAIKISVDDYLLKPARPDKIKEAIDASINRIEEEKQILGDFTYNKSSFRTNYLTCNFAKAKDDLYEILKLDNLEFKDIHDIKEYLIESIDQLAKTQMYNINDKLYMSYYKNLQLANSFSEVLNSLLHISKLLFSSILENKNSVIKDELDLSLQFIELNLSDKIGLNDVAGYVHISPTYYSRLFKENIGLNFIEYLTKRRIKTAKLLLDYTDMTIYEVAENVGFNESNYFSRVFKEAVGLSPTEYRNKNK